jgi:hypothetical protein
MTDATAFHPAQRDEYVAGRKKAVCCAVFLMEHLAAPDKRD